MPMRATGNDDAPPDDLVQLARQFAQALVHELRAQLDGTHGTATEQTKSGGGEKSRLAKERALQLFLRFDELPDDALVDLNVAALLDDCSVATSWRRLRAGLLGEPEYVGGTTRLRVGTLRAARAARAAPADQRERGNRSGPLRASAAAAAAAKAKGKASTETPIEPPAAPTGSHAERGTRTKRSPSKTKAVETA